MSEQELKPCPFCGAEGNRLIVQVHAPHKHEIATFMPDYPGSVTIECAGCQVGMIDATVEAVTAAWNRRAGGEE